MNLENDISSYNAENEQRNAKEKSYEYYFR